MPEQQTLIRLRAAKDKLARGPSGLCQGTAFGRHFLTARDDNHHKNDKDDSSNNSDRSRIHSAPLF